MRSIARLLKVARELELASVPIRRLLALPLVMVPLSGSCTSCARSRHTCRPYVITGQCPCSNNSWLLYESTTLTQWMSALRRVLDIVAPEQVGTGLSARIAFALSRCIPGM